MELKTRVLQIWKMVSWLAMFSNKPGVVSVAMEREGTLSRPMVRHGAIVGFAHSGWGGLILGWPSALNQWGGGGLN